MNYLAAITDFFKSPKWVMNLLLAGICCLIPIVGVMVVTGWLISNFWCREDERFETFPDFDFKFFGRNLERGVWPVLVKFVLLIIILPIIWIASFVLILIVGGASRHGGGGLLSFVLFFFVSVVWYLVLAFAYMFLSPFYLRAARSQDFATAFNFGYAKKFISTMSQEILMSALTLFATMVGMSVLSVIPCISCIAILLLPFLMVLWLFVYFHLINQLYKLFVSRGGEAIPLSPKLTAEPPPPAEPPSAPMSPPPAAPPPSTPLPPAPPPGGPPIN